MGAWAAPLELEEQYKRYVAEVIFANKAPSTSSGQASPSTSTNKWAIPGGMRNDTLDEPR